MNKKTKENKLNSLKERVNIIFYKYKRIKIITPLSPAELKDLNEFIEKFKYNKNLEIIKDVEFCRLIIDIYKINNYKAPENGHQMKPERIDSIIKIIIKQSSNCFLYKLTPSQTQAVMIKRESLKKLIEENNFATDYEFYEAQKLSDYLEGIYNNYININSISKNNERQY